MITLSEVFHPSLVCDLETSTTKRPSPELGFCPKEIILSFRIIPHSCSKTNQMLQFLKLFIFRNILHVSDGLSIHYQEFITVQTATGICQTDTATCLLVGTRCNCSSTSFTLAAGSRISLTYSCWCMCSPELLMMDKKTV
jgi:hypothetical protein